MAEKVHVRIKNNIATFDIDYDTSRIIPYFSYSVENYNYIMRSRPQFRRCLVCHQFPSKRHDEEADHDYVPTWDGKVKFLKRGRVPAGLFRALRKKIEEKEHVRFKVKDRFHAPATRRSVQWLLSGDDYRFQNTCTDAICHAISKGRGGLVLNATGSGKTRVAAMVGSRFDCEILFVVDQLVLLKQAQEEISKHLGEEVGYVGDSKFKLRRFTVATIQTLHLHRNDSKFLRWFKNVEIILIDEIHEMLNRSNFDVIKIAKPLSVIGLTATLGLSKKPVRLKAYALTGPVLYEYPVSLGMKQNVLSKGISVSLVYANEIDPERYTHGEAYSKFVVRNGERNTLIVSLVKASTRKGKYVVVYVDRLKHIEEISERLEKKGIKHGIVSGSYKGKGIKVSKRFKRKDRFEKGDIRCLIVNKVFKKGIDIKRLDLLINASAKPSVNDCIQIFGRGVRKHKDKKGFIQIDISDTDSLDSRFDSRDRNREKKNWFSKAAKRRTRALKKVGITVVKQEFNPDISMRRNAKNVLRFAEKELDKCLNVK